MARNYIVKMGWLLSIVLITSVMKVQAESSLIFESGRTKTQLVELYTSHGCSSCPPAESWLNRFKDHPMLWKQFVPVAFHVDYWDYIGWKDRFAQEAFSKRQRLYRVLRQSQSVYTPGFFVNGKEWRGFFAGLNVPQSIDSAPVIKVNAHRESALIKVEGLSPMPVTMNVAILGMGHQDQVKRGENAGRTLSSDFVVLSHQQQRKTNHVFLFKMPQNFAIYDAKALALAVWISDDQGRVLQATGAALSSDWLF